MARRLDDVRLAALMVDGLEVCGRCHVVALGITTEGVKIPLGLWEGSTENATLATALLSDPVDRGLDPEQGILFVIVTRRVRGPISYARVCTLAPTTGDRSSRGRRGAPR